MRHHIPRPRGFAKVEEVKIAESRVNGGMITSIDPADLPNNALTIAKNVRIKEDKLVRRNGYITGLVPADSEIQYLNPWGVLATDKTLKVFSFKKNDGTAYTVLFAPSKIRMFDSGYSTVTPTVPLAGSDTDRIRCAVVNNELVFTNNGINKIQLLDPVAKTCNDLGNAPSYKYVTGFFDRVFAAHRTDGGARGVELAWSGQGNIDEWDNGVDESAGNTPVIVSPSDFGDHITGIFGLTNALAILRERSIWLGTKQPVVTSPLNLFPVSPEGIGCDCPYSATPVIGGLVFADTRSKDIWFFDGRGGFEPIGRPIFNELFRNVSNPDDLFCTYDPINHEYIIGVPIPNSSYTKLWNYSFRTKTWVYDEIAGATSIDYVELLGSRTTIDSLGEVSINSLTGTIDSLGDVDRTTPTRIVGKRGEVTQEYHTQILNEFASSEIVSKIFEFETDNQGVSRLEFDIECESDGTIFLYTKKDNEDWTEAKAFTVDIERTMLRYACNIYCRQFQFKLVTSTVMFSLMKYIVKTQQAGVDD